MIEHPRYLQAPVRSLQTMLRRISEYNPHILPVIPDGIYGPNTYASVRSFQKYNKLVPNGITDLVTWQAVSNSFSDVTASSRMITWPEEYIIKKNEESIVLFPIQAMLLSIMRKSNSDISLSINGVLDQATSSALCWIQYIADIDQNGNLDYRTFYALLDIHNDLLQM